VGDREGTLALLPLVSGALANARALDWAGERDGDAITVPMTTLDAVTRDARGVRFVKIDIEGAELFALRGARELLRRERPMVYAEFHREYMRANGTSLDDINAFAAGVGYDVRFLKEGGAISDVPPPDDSRFLDAVLVPRG
jgi:hypothetical protein